ncbi:MAG: hypothetical protein ACR2GU_03450 [Rubrobacteraceae bacterium]
MARLLKPGGLLYLFEEHPISWVFDRESSEVKTDPGYGGYFADAAYSSQGWTPQYIGDLNRPKEEQAVKYERQWKLGDVMNALIEAGLGVERFEEHPDRFWNDFPNMPDEEADRFPHTYSLLARKP